MADLDDIEDMITEEELSRSAMDATRKPMVAPKSGAAHSATNVSADTVANVPGTQQIWYVRTIIEKLSHSDDYAACRAAPTAAQRSIVRAFRCG